MRWTFLDFEWSGMSSGEQAYLSILSRLHYANELILARTENTQYAADRKEYPKHIIVLMDEGEQGFHLEWQKGYISFLIKTLPHLFKPHTKIQLVFASHSPITLSDIPASHIVLLKKNIGTGAVQISGAAELSVNTFAGNIYDILKDSFFLSDGFIGKFAEAKINSLITYLNEVEAGDRRIEIAENFVSLDDHSSETFDAESARRLIQLVDEPFLREKLWELFQVKFPFASDEEKELRREIEKLQNQLNVIRGRK